MVSTPARPTSIWNAVEFGPAIVRLKNRIGLRSAPSRCRVTVSAAARSGALDSVDQILARYPNLRTIRGPDHITIPRCSPRGFTVALMTDGGRCTVALGLWYDDFTSVVHAVEYVTSALRGGLRLRVDSDAFGCAHTWAIERLRDEAWIEESVMGMASLRAAPKLGVSTYFRNDPAYQDWRAVRALESIQA